MGRQRLGIFGGTFDPIHNGHLMIARAMQEQLGLDRILFIPDYIPPHKQGWHCSPSADRLAMTILAAAEDPRYTVSAMELERGGVSYTCDTLRQLHRRWHRFYDLYFIIGADSAEQLPTWHNIREAMHYATFAAAAVPGSPPRRRKSVKIWPGRDFGTWSGWIRRNWTSLPQRSGNGSGRANLLTRWYPRQ